MPINSDINDILKMVSNTWSLSKYTSGYIVILLAIFQYIKKLQCKNVTFITFIFLIKKPAVYIAAHTGNSVLQTGIFCGSFRFVEIIYPELKLLRFSNFQAFYFVRIEWTLLRDMSACLPVYIQVSSPEILYMDLHERFRVVIKSILVQIQWLKPLLYEGAVNIFFLNFIKHTPYEKYLKLKLYTLQQNPYFVSV